MKLSGARVERTRASDAGAWRSSSAPRRLRSGRASECRRRRGRADSGARASEGRELFDPYVTQMTELLTQRAESAKTRTT